MPNDSLSQFLYHQQDWARIARLVEIYAVGSWAYRLQRSDTWVGSCKSAGGEVPQWLGTLCARDESNIDALVKPCTKQYEAIQQGCKTPVSSSSTTLHSGYTYTMAVRAGRKAWPDEVGATIMMQTTLARCGHSEHGRCPHQGSQSSDTVEARL